MILRSVATSGAVTVSSEMRVALDSVLQDLDRRYGFSLASAAQPGHGTEIDRKCIAHIALLLSHDKGRLDSCLKRFSEAESHDQFMFLGRLLSSCESLDSKNGQESSTAGSNTQPTSHSHTHPELVPTVQSPALSESNTFDAAAGTPPNPATSFSSQASTIVPSAIETGIQAQNRLEDAATPGQTITPLTSFVTETDGSGAVRDASRTTPTRLHYQLEQIPASGFFCQDIPVQFSNLPLRIRYELQRLATISGTDLFQVAGSDLTNGNDGDYDKFWILLKSCVNGSRIAPTSRKVWDISRDDQWPPELIMSGSLEAQSSKTSAFRLTINPLNYNERSNRMFRKFGSHRFFKLMIPSSADILGNAKQLRGVSEDVITDKLLQWLNHGPKALFGCQWIPIFNRPAKATRKQEKKFKSKAHREDAEFVQGSTGWRSDPRREVMFFAVSGPGLKPLDRTVISNYIVPLQLNADMAMCKAYSRWDLSFSTTFPTLVFKPEQIHEEDDICADGAEDDTSLNDPKLKPEWDRLYHTPHAHRVMTDGCGLISYAAAKKVWSILGEEGRMPSAFQGRIGPCKGVWSVYSEPHSELFNEDDIWLTCTFSQMKFKRHPEDYGKTYDEHRMTFEVSNWSRRAPNSKLHPDFLPILEDRGVSRRTLKLFVEKNLQEQGRSARTPWTRPERGTLEWLEENMPTDSEKNRGSAWSGLASKNNPQKARAMAMAGFNPKSSPILSDLVKRLVKQHLLERGQELRINIANSTSAMGIADPFGCLGPSEIFFFPSDTDLFGTSLLAHIDVLVSRHPAKSPCDIQRVHAVVKPQLMHLRDVVVFPSTGCYPLAGKLQGGDYDGDTFWICADQSLVLPFRNAPPAAEPPQPADYDIEQDKQEVEDFLSSPDGIDEFYKRSFRFAWQESMLGQVTNFHEKLRYQLGPQSMWNEKVKRTLNIHDLIIDAAKNGYTFTPRHFRAQTSGYLPSIQEPLYKMPGKIASDDTRIERYNSIVDHLLFRVAKPTIASILEELDELYVHGMAHHDADVEGLLDLIREGHDHKPSVCSALQTLEDEIRTVPARLNQLYSKAASFKSEANASFGMSMTNVSTNQQSLWSEYEFEILDWYKQLGASVQKRGKPKAWFIPLGGNAFSMWDFIKASALYRFWPQNKNMIMVMAGSEICELKAGADPYSESIRSNLFADIKIKKRRREEIDEESPLEATSEDISFESRTSASFDSHTAEIGGPLAKSLRLMQAKETAKNFLSNRPSPLSRSFIPRFVATPLRTNSTAGAVADIPIDDQPPEEIETEVETDDEMSEAGSAEYQTATEDARMHSTVQKLSQGYSQLSIHDDAHE